LARYGQGFNSLQLASPAASRGSRKNTRPHGKPLRSMTVLFTARLRLEPFGEHHLDGLHAMNARPEVMRYISGRPETREQTAESIARVQRCWAAWGTSWWAFIELQSGRVAGAGAVQHLRREAAPAADLELLQSNPLEIGWRLHPDFWRQGLASEGAARMAAFAFHDLAAMELLAVRHPDNAASAHVMDRLGMRFRALEPWYGKTLATHVLTRAEWQNLQLQRDDA
jgi:RimJ/RimL family protein N-acetyltransferase